MKRILLGVLALSFSGTGAWAKCDPDQIAYYRTTSYGLNLNQGSSLFSNSITVNIPLMINGERACYHQSSSLLVKTEKIKEDLHVDYEITPLLATFENVPEPATFQYLNIDYDPDQKASQVQIASFLCSGETPIGGDAFSDSLVKLTEKKDEVSTDVRIFIATGQAAENISASQAKKARAKVFDKFLNIFETREGSGADIEADESNIYIPNILSGISIRELTDVDRKLYSTFFSRTNSSINGCSKKFRESMSDYLIENISRIQPFKNIELKRKRFSPKYRLRWTL